MYEVIRIRFRKFQVNDERKKKREPYNLQLRNIASFNDQNRYVDNILHQIFGKPSDYEKLLSLINFETENLGLDTAIFSV